MPDTINAVGRDFDEIVEAGVIKIAVYEDYPPYSWEEGGKAKGIDVDIARLIAEDLADALPAVLQSLSIGDEMAVQT